MNKKQILRRIMQIVIVLIGISFVTFLLTYLSPGDPVRNMFSATGVMPTEELVQQTRDEMGLNDPFSPSISAGCLTVCMAILENPTA